MSDSKQVQNSQQLEVDINELKRQRIEKLEQQCANGKNPFENVSYPVDAYANEIKIKFAEYCNKNGHR